MHLPSPLRQTGEGGIPLQRPLKFVLCLNSLQKRRVPEQGTIQPWPGEARQDMSHCSSRHPAQENHGLWRGKEAADVSLHVRDR